MIVIKAPVDKINNIVYTFIIFLKEDSIYGIYNFVAQKFRKRLHIFYIQYTPKCIR